MSLEAILKEINNEAEAEVQKILKSARSESVKLRHRYAREIQELEKKERLKHESRVKELRNINMANAHRTGRQIRLLTEERLIDHCFEKLGEELNTMSGEEYDEFLKSLVVEGANLLDGELRIQAVRKSDHIVLDGIINALKKEGNAKITLDETLLPEDLLGGIYMISADGKKIVDNTIRSILERNKEHYRIVISDILFSKK